MLLICVATFGGANEKDKVVKTNKIIKEEAPTEYYRVEITRVDSNLYKARQGFYIKTKWCYEYATREEAVLVYEKYSYNNKLIFKNGTSCDVEKVF